MEQRASFRFRVYAGMQPPVLAFHIDAAGLLRHSVIIAHSGKARRVSQALFECLPAHRLILELFPAAAVDEKAVFERKGSAQGGWQKYFQII